MVSYEVVWNQQHYIIFIIVLVTCIVEYFKEYECNEHEIEKLQLENKNLASLSSEIGKFKQLRELDLNNNQLVLLPLQICELK